VRVHTADERGITLQTLIVTAVLVLMAVAAGVVIVAITNSASDDLEEQTTSINPLCNGVEVYDPLLASSGNEGQNGGNTSDTIGCIPVCVWSVGGADDSTIGVGEISIMRKLENNTPTQAVDYTVGDIAAGNIFLFEDVDELFGTLTIGDPDATPAGEAKVEFASNIAEVRVSPDQRSCRAYTSTGDIVT